MHGKEKVAGMVIVDSAITRTKLPDSWPTLLGDASYVEVVGLEKNRVLSDEEWREVNSDGEQSDEAVAEEEKCMSECTRSINERIKAGGEVLGVGRLSVVFCDESVDFGKVLAWGVKHGNESTEVRMALKIRLEDMSEVDERGQREHLSLSSRSQFVFAEGIARTHNVHMVCPELISQEVKWVLEGVGAFEVLGTQINSQ